MQEWLHDVKIITKNSEETRLWKENLQLILCQQDLITVFKHNEKASLERSILSALMNNLTKNSLVDQLHLAMKLDQVELAQDAIDAAREPMKGTGYSLNSLMTRWLLDLD